MKRLEKPAPLRRLFRLGANTRARWFRVNGWWVSSKNVLAHYLDLASVAGTVAGLQKFTGRAVRRRATPHQTPGLEHWALDGAIGSVCRERILGSRRVHRPVPGTRAGSCIATCKPAFPCCLDGCLAVSS